MSVLSLVLRLIRSARGRPEPPGGDLLAEGLSEALETYRLNRAIALAVAAAKASPPRARLEALRLSGRPVRDPNCCTCAGCRRERRALVYALWAGARMAEAMAAADGGGLPS